MRLAAVGAAVALFATACGGGAGEEPGQEGGELKVYLGEPEHLIPGNTNETQGGTVLRVLYQGLVDYDAQGKPRNVIAESIETDDQKVWTIKLKKGFKFHNGEAVNADAFIRSWNHTGYGPNALGNNYFMDRIEGYEDLNPVDPDGEGPKKAPEPKSKEMSGLKKVDDYTFEVTLKEPFQAFSMMVGYTAFYPMAQECVDDTKKCEEAPIGNGPYQIDGTWQHDRQIKTKRFADYAGDKGKVDRITFTIFKDEDAGYAALQSGEIDIMTTAPVSKIAELRNQFGDRLIEEPTSAFHYLGFPTYQDEFKNKKLRQALSLAIDRAAIMKQVFSDTNVPASSLVSPVVPGHRDDACQYCEFDPERAKQLLEEAGGWPEGKKLTLWFNAGSGHEDWVKPVGDMLKKNLGIDYQLEGELDFPQYLEKADQKKFTGLFRLGWVMDYPSPENYLKPIHGTQGSSNNTGYSNPAADKLIAEGDAAATLEDGIAKYQEAEDLMLEDMPVIPMYFGRSRLAYNDNVGGVKFSIVDSDPFWTDITVK